MKSKTLKTVSVVEITTDNEVKRFEVKMLDMKLTPLVFYADRCFFLPWRDIIEMADKAGYFELS